MKTRNASRMPEVQSSCMRLCSMKCSGSAAYSKAASYASRTQPLDPDPDADPVPDPVTDPAPDPDSPACPSRELGTCVRMPRFAAPWRTIRSVSVCVSASSARCGMARSSSAEATGAKRSPRTSEMVSSSMFTRKMPSCSSTFAPSSKGTPCACSGTPKRKPPIGASSRS